MQVDCSIRIGLSAVDAVWRNGGPAASARHSERLPLGSDAQTWPDCAETGAALGRVLEAMPARRRRFSPHLRVMLADPLLQMAVLRFNQLPRARADVELLVTQRFCRDHRIEPGAVSIAYSVQGAAGGERHVMVCALNAALAGSLQQRLNARRLHADVMTTESMYAIRALAGVLSPAPSLLLLLYSDYATVILWAAPDTAGHIGVFQQHQRPRAEFLATLKTRLKRYAAAGGYQPDSVGVDVLACGDDPAEAEVFRDLPHPVRNLWRDAAAAAARPAARPAWELIAEAGG